MTINNNHYPASAMFAVVVLTVLGTLVGCSESTAVHETDAAMTDSGGLFDVSLRDSESVDAASIDATSIDATNREADAVSMDVTPIDGGVMDAADVPEDAAYIRYERDLRPLLEASACGDCHAGVGVEMDYAWISAPGEGWCDPSEYDRRWNCFEVHARTQVWGHDVCTTDFYHRHGEPCFMDETQSRVLAWAADGYRE